MSMTHLLARIVAVALPLSIAGIVAPARAAVFYDGSFESITSSGDRNSGYTFGAWTVGDPNKLGADAWTSSSHNDAVYTRFNTPADASEGVDSLTFLSGRPMGEVFQTFDTTINNSYTVTFDVKERQVSTQQSVNARVFNGLLPITTSTFRSSIDLPNASALGGVQVADVSSAWTTYSFNFTATGTTSTLSLLARDSTEKQITLDNVTLTDNGPVPEPASMALMAIGGMLIFARRHRAL